MCDGRRASVISLRKRSAVSSPQSTLHKGQDTFSCTLFLCSAHTFMHFVCTQFPQPKEQNVKGSVPIRSSWHIGHTSPSTGSRFSTVGASVPARFAFPTLFLLLLLSNHYQKHHGKHLRLWNHIVLSKFVHKKTIRERRKKQQQQQ